MAQNISQIWYLYSFTQEVIKSHTFLNKTSHDVWRIQVWTKDEQKMNLQEDDLALSSWALCLHNFMSFQLRSFFENTTTYYN